MAGVAGWLPNLEHLSLSCVNSQDARGAWPTAVLTYTDVGLFTSLRRLEIIDSHLPFLELGVADVSGLRTLTALRSLHLVFSEREHAWPGSKPCYLLLGLDEVSEAAEGLEELVLDGVQLAKLVGPRWPSLTTLCLGFISGWHPALMTALQLDAQAPRLKRLSLGPIKCVRGVLCVCLFVCLCRCTCLQAAMLKHRNLAAQMRQHAVDNSAVDN
jgi:hypothetical protein